MRHSGASAQSFLHRRPALLAALLGARNRVRRLTTDARSVAALAAIAGLGVTLAALAASGGRAALALQWLLDYPAIAVAACALHAAMSVARRRRMVPAARARSWLVATPRAASGSRASAAGHIALPLVWQLAATAAAVGLMGLDAAVTAEQCLRAISLVAIGLAVGGLFGWWLSPRSAADRNEASRYTPRRRERARHTPSAEALSDWPIAQAFAWGRPENARMLALVAILSVPMGTGALGGVLILATWALGSYLVALLLAVAHAARTAAEWLRSTPIAFWAFAWPLARRALAHQTVGTAVAVTGSWWLGTPVVTALYVGVLWMTVVVLSAAVSLADCYRARPAGVKTALSVLAALLAEQRAHGSGIALALLLTAWHWRRGAGHARA